MDLAVEHLAFASAAAAQIDRLVIRGHELADAYGDKPPAVAALKAFPQLLNLGAIVLLRRALTRDDVQRIAAYTPAKLIDALIDNNITEGVVIEEGGLLALTEGGRAAAEGVVHVQEACIDGLWSGARDHLNTVERTMTNIVDEAKKADPPRTPSNFALFAAVCDRPTLPGRVLRLITAVRYWRADAHVQALTEAGLRPFESHALNRLWDAHRDVDRVGQGFAEPGRKGVASLEARGLALAGVITLEGIELRERIEHETDRLTLPIYDPLDGADREELLTALTALPSDA